MTPELWTPRKRGSNRIECAPFGFGVGFARPPKILGGLSSPLAISGCVDWHRADLGTHIATGVSQWDDQSGTGDANKNLLQGTAAKQPTLNASDVLYNNRSTLSVAGAASQFLRSGIWAVALAQPCTVFIVGNDDHSASVGAYFDGLAFASMLIDNNGTNYQAYAGAALPIAWGAANAPTSFVAAYNGASSSFWMSAKTAGSTGNAGAAGVTGFTLGILGDSTTAPLNGKIAEFAVWNRALTGAEVGQLQAYAGTRYGITIGP